MLLALALTFFIDPLTITLRHSFWESGVAGQQYSAALSLSGNTLLMSAPYATVGAMTNQGKVFVYVRNGSGWQLQASLVASDGSSNDNFGKAVYLNGDIAIIGAPGDSNSGFGIGSAYVYERNGTTWTEVTKLLDTDGLGGALGSSVYITPTWALVGAPNRVSNRGACIYYERLGAFWFQVASFSPADVANGDNFGLSMSVVGDEAVIGSPADDNPANNSGSAYVFARSGSSWTEQAKLSDASGAAQNALGQSISFHGDRIALGSPNWDSVAPAAGDAGSVVVFERSAGVWQQTARLVAPSPVSGAKFGSSVALDTDSIVIGGSGGSNSAYPFANVDGGWYRETEIPSYDISFGSSLAFSPGVLIVGAPMDSSPGGSAYEFRFSRSSAFTSFCFGDGTGVSCPCGNNGAVGSGCGSSVNPLGAVLSASGNDMLQHDTVTLSLSGTGYFAPGLYFQGTQQQNGGLGVVLGDGLACVGGTAIRLAVKPANGGASIFPDPTAGDPLLSVRGQIPPIGGTRYYQVWYRNNAVYCAPETFNLSNAVSVLWVP